MTFRIEMKKTGMGRMIRGVARRTGALGRLRVWFCGHPENHETCNSVNTCANKFVHTPLITPVSLKKYPIESHKLQGNQGFQQVRTIGVLGLVPFVDYKEDVHEKHERHERHEMDSEISQRGYAFAVIQEKPKKWASE